MTSKLKHEEMIRMNKDEMIEALWGNWAWVLKNYIEDFHIYVKNRLSRKTRAELLEILIQAEEEKPILTGYDSKNVE